MPAALRPKATEKPACVGGFSKTLTGLYLAKYWSLQKMRISNKMMMIKAPVEM